MGPEHAANEKAQPRRPTELKLAQAKKAAAVGCSGWFGAPPRVAEET